MKRKTYLLIAVLLIGCTTKNNEKALGQLQDTALTKNQTPTVWQFDKVVGSKLVFNDNKSIETNLFGLKSIGQIECDGHAPFFIFSGRDCNDCDANISIYIHSPEQGQIAVEDGQNRYQYPGKEKDYESDVIFYKARAFFGQVLENIKGVIWYQDQLLENGKRENSVFLAYIDNNTVKDSLLAGNGNLKQTLSLMNKGLCFEIKGQEYTSEP
jgi:hypothetical protein